MTTEPCNNRHDFKPWRFHRYTSLGENGQLHVAHRCIRSLAIDSSVVSRIVTAAAPLSALLEEELGVRGGAPRVRGRRLPDRDGAPRCPRPESPVGRLHHTRTRPRPISPPSLSPLGSLQGMIFQGSLRPGISLGKQDSGQGPELSTPGSELLRHVCHDGFGRSRFSQNRFG